MSLAPFVCWERDGIALGWNGEGGGERGMEGEAKRGKGGGRGRESRRRRRRRRAEKTRMYGERRKREGTEGRK